MLKTTVRILLFALLSIIGTISHGQDMLWSKVQDDHYEGRIVITDKDNNVYVAARDLSMGSSIIKYNSEGNELFVLNNDSALVITGLKLGNDGKIFWAGYTNSSTDFYGIMGAYNPDGSVHFVQKYDQGFYDTFNDLEIDQEGNSYVTGSTQTSNGFQLLIIKYSPEGTQKWVQHYCPDSSNQYFGEEIMLDGSGNIYIAGKVNLGIREEIIFLEYSSDGSFQYEVISELGVYEYVNPYAMVLDNENNAFICGEISENYGYHGFILRISEGLEVWSDRIESINGFVIFFDTVIDDEGNIWVAGYNDDSAGWAYVSKYSPAGDTIFTYRYAGLVEGQESFRSIEYQDGHAYLTGTCKGIDTTAKDMIAVCLDNNGAMVWDARYNGSGNGHDFAADIAIDSDLNVIITGRSENSKGTACTTLKISNPLGIADHLGTESVIINVYPNPASSLLNFEIDVERQDTRYIISNTFGQIVQSGYIDNTPTQQINLIGLHAGTYFLQITDGSKQFYAKFVKQ